MSLRSYRTVSLYSWHPNRICKDRIMFMIGTSELENKLKSFWPKIEDAKAFDLKCIEFLEKKWENSERKKTPLKLAEMFFFHWIFHTIFIQYLKWSVHVVISNRFSLSQFDTNWILIHSSFNHSKVWISNWFLSNFWVFRFIFCHFCLVTFVLISVTNWFFFWNSRNEISHIQGMEERQNCKVN